MMGLNFSGQNLPKELSWELSKERGDIDSSSEKSNCPCDISRESGAVLEISSVINKKATRLDCFNNL